MDEHALAPAPARRRRLHVVTFATPDFANSAEVLRHSAVKVGGADVCRVYGPSDACVCRFYERSGTHHDLRGAGFWGWKPAVIADALDRARDGDVVLYLDAAIIVEADLRAALDVDDDGDGIAWTIRLFRLGEAERKGYTNEAWTKPSALDAMRASEAERAALQVNAAVQAYRRHPVALEFVRALQRWCAMPSVLADDALFPNHRHDQSVLSVLAARHASIVCLGRDPTQHGARDPPLLPADGPPWLDHHRRRIGRIPTVAVITPSVGSPHLAAAIRSVANQTVAGVQHWIVVDGPEHEPAVLAAAREWADRACVRLLQLPQNVGAGGWNGHRVYGSLPWLVDTTHVAFLDEDNEWDEDHLEAMLEAMRDARAAWAFSLRRIVDAAGRVVCDDRCESLGPLHHTVCGKGDWLVDTNCYLIDRELAIAASPVWNARFRDERPDRPEPDRQLCRALMSSSPFAIVRRSTVSYRLGSTPRSVRADFFLEGNRALRLDFSKPDLYVFHFSADATARYFATRAATDRSYALDEWQMTLLRGLERDYNLMDGFANVPAVPPGATALACLCAPADLPLDFFAARTDLHRVAYTLESPNIRHGDQWKRAFLEKHFDALLTYWEPLLADPGPRLRAVFCPHNTHSLDLDGSEADRALLRRNAGRGRSVVMVLEWRPFLDGSFYVDGRKLTCLDPQRGRLVEALRDATVVGQNWRTYDRNPRLHVASDAHRSRDDRHAVDWYADHVFALIVENVDAEGYVSEKLYDALIAGAIPLYWGNASRRLLERVPALEGLYVDVRGKTSRDVQAILDGMTDAEVEAFRERIYARREDVLRAVGVRAFAAAAAQALRASRV